jgi:DNA-binding transcriptional LysR family regulator
VQVFPGIEAPSPSSYWLVWPIDPPPSPRAIAFRDWLMAEVAPGRREPRPVARRTRRTRQDW